MFERVLSQWGIFTYFSRVNKNCICFYFSRKGEYRSSCPSSSVIRTRGIEKPSSCSLHMTNQFFWELKMGCHAVCTMIFGTCLVTLIFLLPIGLTIGFGISLYSFPTTLSYIAIGYHFFCIIIHLLALSIYIFHQRKLMTFRKALKNYFSTIIICGFLLIFQSVFSTLGIIVGIDVVSTGPNIVCNYINATETPPPEGSVNMDSKFNLKSCFKTTKSLKGFIDYGF